MIHAMASVASSDRFADHVIPRVAGRECVDYRSALVKVIRNSRFRNVCRWHVYVSDLASSSSTIITLIPSLSFIEGLFFMVLVRGYRVERSLIFEKITYSFLLLLSRERSNPKTVKQTKNPITTKEENNDYP
jgi:hypothetical protein